MYSYYEYIQAWTNVLLFQKPNMSHSWFINWGPVFSINKKERQFLMWFLRWFHRHSPLAEMLLEDTKKRLTIFAVNYKVTEYNSNFPMILLFFTKYHIPWIIKWQYVIKGNIFWRQYSVKWWNGFSEERIIKFVDEEFPQKNKLEIDKPSSSKASIESILEGRSTTELAELAAHLFAKAANQEKESHVSSEGSSSNKPLKVGPSKPSNWYENSQDQYEAYDHLGEI